MVNETGDRPLATPHTRGRHLLFLADRAWPDAAGGAQTAAWNLGLGLISQGHRVTFLTPSSDAVLPRTEWCDGIELLRHEGAGSFKGMLVGGRHAALDLRARATPHLVHSHFAYAELGPRLGMGGDATWVRTFHGPWNEEGWIEETHGRSGSLLKARVIYWIRRMIERRSLGRACRVVVLSEYARGLAIALGAKPEHIRLIPGGSDLRRYHPGGGRMQARQRLGLMDGGPWLLTVRRLVPRMGVEALVRAMVQVRQELPGVKLIIGGRGPESTKLAELIKNLNLEKEISLVGFIPDHDLADYYRAADLFVLPTTSLEGFGLVTVDALACGTPVLGTPVGATPEILRPLDARLLAPDASMSGLAEGILSFLRGRWRNEFTPERLHDYVNSRYTWDKHTEGVLGVYREVLSISGGYSS